LSEGLDRALELDVGRGYLDAMLGVSITDGPFARAEAGWHPLDPLALFAYGQWTPDGSSAGVGARVVF
jgi:hypothetical protein